MSFTVFKRPDNPFYQVRFLAPGLKGLRRTTRKKIRASAEEWASLSLKEYRRTGHWPGTKLQDIGLKADHS
jgi:hypothetical protein